MNTLSSFSGGESDEGDLGPPPSSIPQAIAITVRVSSGTAKPLEVFALLLIPQSEDASSDANMLYSRISGADRPAQTQVGSVFIFSPHPTDREYYW